MPSPHISTSGYNSLAHSEPWLAASERTEEEIQLFKESIEKKSNQSVELIPCALGILFNDAKEVLLLRRTVTDRSYPDTFSFPGGRFEPEDTSLENTVIRETLQETGLKTLVAALHSTRFTAIANRMRIYQVAFFILDCPDTAKPIQLSDEHSNYAWVAPVLALEKPQTYPLSGGIVGDILRQIST